MRRSITRTGLSSLGLLLMVAALALALVSRGAVPAVAAPANINGAGSSYVAVAMQQWTADAQSQGLSVNYQPSSSPDGLSKYAATLIDFAGTEAEFSALAGSGGSDPGLDRGYQYVPDVAGAIAVMYNADDKAGRKIDYLHLSRETIAKIFTGAISNWSDPAISADNKGLQLPDEPITVVYRAGQSGTTALFYDFVQHTDPGLFNSWAGRNGLPTTVRIIQLDSTPGFAPKTLAQTSSDQIAQYVASDQGKWSISYDEFAYSKVFGVPAAWVQNQSGNYVQPYAANISAALATATLRPDLSQELSGVYASPDPAAYPISAYSYIVAQCVPSGDRATCKGPYSNGGITETFQKWLRYIACDGQVNMARIGYSPLPPNLSQEISNSIGRLSGAAPEQLNAGNCANPRFLGNLGADASSPQDPLDAVQSLAGGGGGAAAAAGAGSGAAAAGDAGAGAGKSGAVKSAGGGSTDVRLVSPVAYNRPGPPGTPAWPLLAFLAVLAVPPIVVGVRGLRRGDF